MSTNSQNSETLAGLIERVTFHSEESGFCVLRVKARGHRDLITVVGHAATITAGEWITATGRWVNDFKHGLQLKADFLKASPPTTLEGIEKYLGSGMIYGIGPVYGKRLVQAFGDQVFDVIEHSPHRLREVEGIGPKRESKIIQGWAQQKVVREIMLFLHSHGVGTSRAVRIYKTYGDQAVEVMSNNPYQLATDIRGIGFVTADGIAERLGIGKDAEIRVRAGISYALSKAMEQGHCGYPRDQLLVLAQELLGVEVSLIDRAVDLELTEESVTTTQVENINLICLTHLVRAEENIAQRLRFLSEGPPAWPEIALDKAISWVEGRVGIDLATSQKEALQAALCSNVSVITGGPGVGKTTLLKSFLEILSAKKVEIKLAAPTGKAAKRMSEATGREATTIHRLLQFDPKTGGFKHNEDERLECQLLVVDEASMIDVQIMNSLVKSLPDTAGLVLVGDIDQLPSVGAGSVLGDIIQSAAITTVRLTEVFRQAASSQIIVSAHTINSGKSPDLTNAARDSDFFFIEADEPEIGSQKLLEIVKTRLPRKYGLSAIDDIQVLCPMNRGGVGARALNVSLQEALNPKPVEARIERFGYHYAVGDKVMQIQNDYDKDVYNGDQGCIKTLDKTNGTLVVSFEIGDIEYQFGELDMLVPAYAMSIHKSQGSEYPCVVIPMFTQHYPMLQRNLLYTAVTRGKRLVIILGQRKAVAMAARNKSSSKRWTNLLTLLKSSTETSQLERRSGELL